MCEDWESVWAWRIRVVDLNTERRFEERRLGYQAIRDDGIIVTLGLIADMVDRLVGLFIPHRIATCGPKRLVSRARGTKITPAAFKRLRSSPT